MKINGNNMAHCHRENACYLSWQNSPEHITYAFRSNNFIYSFDRGKLVTISRDCYGFSLRLVSKTKLRKLSIYNMY